MTSPPRTATARLSGPRAAGVLRAAALAVLLAGPWLPACGDGHAERANAALAEAEAKLPDDPSGALFIAKQALTRAADADGRGDPRLALVAAAACLKLERRGEAIEFADLGLAAPDLAAALQGDLQWARGAGLMGRYRELGDEADWRAASLALEQATQAGSHRLEAAVLMVGLQDLGKHSNDERQLKFARLVIELDAGPGRDGQYAARVRKLLEAKGLTP